MHALANPARFLRLARPVTTWLLLIGLVLAIGGMVAGLTLTPRDYLQGDTVRIMETRPLSKDKRWRVVEIIERAR